MSGSVRVTLFSVEEANRVVTEVRPIVERLVRARGELDRTESRMDVLVVALSGAGEANPDRAELSELRVRRKAVGAEVERHLRTLQRRGCLVKDVARGLLDFYAVSGDRLIFLCWKLGEDEITHWHSLEGGFGARQPLNSTDFD